MASPVEAGGDNGSGGAASDFELVSEPAVGSIASTPRAQEMLGGTATPKVPSVAAASSSGSDTEVAERVPLGVYVVSVGTKSGVRRLHFSGSCGMRPGIDYPNFKVLGEEGPKPDEYDRVCRLCWPSGEGVPTSSSSDSSGPAAGEDPSSE